MKHIVVFTMDGCPHCGDFKEMLVKENIEFIEADIDENKEEYDMFVKITENEYVPAIMIVNETDRAADFLAPDRDFQDLDEAISKIKSII